MTDEARTSSRDSAAMRRTALLLSSLAMFYAYIFVDILSPIKELMQEQRGWGSTALGTILGSGTSPNVFIFFPIFAGTILDKMGVHLTTILSGTVMLTGALIKYYAISNNSAGSTLDAWFIDNLSHIPIFELLGVSPFCQGMPVFAKVTACGFTIFDCGVKIAGVTVSRGTIKWFKGREVALTTGSEMVLARLGVVICIIFSPPFTKLGGDTNASRSVAFGVVPICTALMMFVVYFFMDRKFDSLTGKTEEKDDPFKISGLGKILSSMGF